MIQDVPIELRDARGGEQPHSEFRVSDTSEIRALMKSLMDRGVIVNLNGSDGSSHSGTVWTVDEVHNKIGITAELTSMSVQRLVEADEATAVGYLDQIRLQFDVTHRVLVHGRQGCVLQAEMPRVLYRFQRRSAFRVRTLERSAPSARFRHPEMPDMTLDLRVLDVSTGGCALFMPSDMPMVPPGVAINGASIELDLETDLRATLMVHHVTSIQPHARGTRLGCELLNLSGDDRRALQRYIDQTQKRRRMMSLD